MKKWLLLLLVLPAASLPQEKHFITVRGQKVPFVFDAKRQIIIIEGRVLREMPAGSLPELLGAAANIHFTRRGLFQADPQLAGFNQEQLLVMMNGMPQNNSQTGHHNLMLPCEVSQIERIEIARSAYSSLSGSAGAAGAINIVTVPANSIHLRGGSFGTASADFNLKLGDWGVGGGLSASNGFQKGLDGRKEFIAAAGRVGLGKGQLDLWGGWTSARFGAANFYAPYNSFEELDRLLGTVHWQCPLGPRSALEARASLQFSDDRYTLIRSAPESYFNRHMTWQQSLEAEIHRYSERWSLRLGTAIWADQISSSGVRNGNPVDALGSHQRICHALLAEWSGELGRFFLNSGLRLTQGSFRDWGGHFLAGLPIDSSLTSEIALFRNFRVPTYTELYYSDPQHLANPELAPEKTWGIALSLRRQKANQGSELRLFINKASDLIDWVGDSERKIWQARNIQKGTFWGVDARQTFSIGRASISVLYTFQQVRFSLDPATQPLKYHYYFPSHALSLRFSQEISRWSLSSVLKAEIDESRGQTRFFLNLRLGRSWGPFYFYADGLNLFDVRMEKIPGLPESPRSFSLGMSFRPM